MRRFTLAGGKGAVLTCGIFLVFQLVLLIAYTTILQPGPGDDVRTTISPYSVDGQLPGRSRITPIDRARAILQSSSDSEKTIATLFPNPTNEKLMRNMLMELKKHKINNYLLFTMDSVICDRNPTENCYDYVTPGMERQNYKVEIWNTLLQSGYNILAISPDVFFQDNPALYFDRTVDINAMVEVPLNLEKSAVARRFDLTEYYSSGFFFMRNTPQSALVMQEMRKTVLKYTDEDELFNAALHSVKVLGQLKINALDRALFSNGFTAFFEVPRMAGAEAVVYRSNWCQGEKGVIYRARELLVWHEADASRVMTPRKYLTFSTQNDFVTLQMQKDYLMLALFLAKIFDRVLILPKFHCYIAQSPSCNFDALFDVNLVSDSVIFEHSLTHNPKLILRRKKVILKIQSSSVDDFRESMQGDIDEPLIEVAFPKLNPDGHYLHFGLISTPEDDLRQLMSEIMHQVRFSPDFVMRGDRAWPPDDKLSVCVVTNPYNTKELVSTLKKIGDIESLYVMSYDPSSRVSPKVVAALDPLYKRVVHYSYDELWVGHKLVPNHLATTHVQVDSCQHADQVIVNTWEPYWLIQGICGYRSRINKTSCINITPL